MFSLQLSSIWLKDNCLNISCFGFICAVHNDVDVVLSVLLCMFFHTARVVMLLIGLCVCTYVRRYTNQVVMLLIGLCM
jgi:hypothetical protein